MANDILIIAEQREGRLHPLSLQLVTLAKTLAPALGGSIVASVVGHNTTEPAEKMAASGAARVITVDDPALALYSSLAYTRAVSAVVDKVAPRVVLIGTTFMGRDLAPRLAVRNKAALATDCTEVWHADGRLHIRRPICNGKATAELTLAPDRLNIVSVRNNTYGAPEGGGSAAKESLAWSAPPTDARVKTTELVRAGGTVKDVTEADIVVAGGRSLKSQENFKILYELAEVLDGAVGASRAATDAGYQPHSRQVGLTGKTVTPRLYLAFGIDGAIQHLAGMRGSKVIVAVNTKADAPIFQVANYGIVADLFTMVPLLTAEFKKLLQH